ncbi:MAG: hypothetical protein V5A38_03875 [Halolamina sp.]|uniref:alpha/beta fold hydrolase n=1 Tax=Halolamina sp. TaxID=1940283 RepID=UPI002FC3BFFE
MHAAAEHGERLDGLVLAGSAYNWRRPRMLLLSGLFFGLSLLFDAISLSDRLNGRVTDRLSGGIDEPLRAHAAGLAERVGGEQACYTGGHQAPMEQTDEFAGPVREFLEGVTREAQPTAVRE